jgi:hypothetical protein
MLLATATVLAPPPRCYELMSLDHETRNDLLS